MTHLRHRGRCRLQRTRSSTRAKALAIRASDPDNRDYGISDQDCSDQPGLMLPARITLPHFSVSSAMCFPKSVGEPENGVPPRSASRALILGSARAAFISLLSLSTISAGVLLGAPMPDHPLTSNPGIK